LVQVSFHNDLEASRLQRFRHNSCIIGRVLQRPHVVGAVANDQGMALGVCSNWGGKQPDQRQGKGEHPYT